MNKDKHRIVKAGPPRIMPVGTLSGLHQLRQRNWAKRVHQHVNEGNYLSCCAGSRKKHKRSEGSPPSADSSTGGKKSA